MTTIACCNACDACTPSFFIFKGVRVAKMYKQELRSGSEIGTTDSVYISDDVFFSNGFNIFRSTFFSYLGWNFLWFVPKVLKYCRKMGTDMLCPPLHTTLFLQPLDRTTRLFKPFQDMRAVIERQQTCTATLMLQSRILFRENFSPLLAMKAGQIGSLSEVLTAHTYILLDLKLSPKTIYALYILSTKSSRIPVTRHS